MGKRLMHIKEIAQKLVHGYWKRDQWNIEYFDSVGFAEALISAYKAELQKEVQGGQPDLGEPVAWKYKKYSGGVYVSEHRWDKDQNLYDEEPLYTPDQVAAAILKATKSLEERICDLTACKWPDAYTVIPVKINGQLHATSQAIRDEINSLRAKLAAAQVENERLENQVLARDAELWGRTQEILGLKDQLAKAEQRVAEACAKVCDGCSSEGVIANWKAEYFSKAIRQGAWRKFVKEV